MLSDRRYVTLNSGYNMPLLGWGSSGADGEDAVQAVKAAIRIGFRVTRQDLTQLRRWIALHVICAELQAEPITASSTKLILVHRHSKLSLIFAAHR